MISVHALSHHYVGRKVLSGIDTVFPEGQLSALIGANGAGKSTLLMLMARQMQPAAGELRLAGTPLSQLTVRQFALQVATLRQFPDFRLRLTLEELVAFGRYPHSQGRLGLADKAAVDDAIDYLGLSSLCGRYVDELSGGQRQLAFLAMTIAQQTPLLLLDEPLNNLDIRHAIDIMRALRRLCDERGRTVIMVIHDINLAANYADHIVAMKHGQVYASGGVADVMQSALLGEVFGLDFDVQRQHGGYVCNYFTYRQEDISHDKQELAPGAALAGRRALAG